MRRSTASLLTLLVSALIFAGCPGAGVPGMPGGGGDVDPNKCGAYAQTDVGGKIKAFLEATVQLNEGVLSAEADMKGACVAMAGELGVPTAGDTATVCNAVAEAIRNKLSGGLAAQAKLTMEYTPPECTVNVDAAAEVTAKCEAKASADVSVTCTGTCTGTCNGQCDGECEGTLGSSGQCEGQCKGNCSGSCSGGCSGHADVEASAECEASGEVRANVQAECTEPEVNVAFEAEAVVNKPDVDAVVAALKAGMPKMLQLQAKISGPVKVAFVTWSGAATGLAKSSGKLMGALGDQAMCVSAQLGAAAGLVAKIQASLDVQIEVSASVSASASAEGSASAGG